MAKKADKEKVKKALKVYGKKEPKKDSTDRMLLKLDSESEGRRTARTQKIQDELTEAHKGVKANNKKIGRERVIERDKKIGRDKSRKEIQAIKDGK